MWLTAVHGDSAGWVTNIEHDPQVRIRVRRQWRDGTAEIHPFTPVVAARFNFYARGGPILLGISPRLVFVRWAAAEPD